MSPKADISFSISPSSGVPIFRQIIDQVERLVSCGMLKGGDLLPSVNEVSRQLSINPMTISRAYNLLSERGVLIRLRGIGMQVAPDAAKPADARLAMLDSKIDELWLQSDQLGLSRKDVIDYLAARDTAAIDTTAKPSPTKPSSTKPSSTNKRENT